MIPKLLVFLIFLYSSHSIAFDDIAGLQYWGTYQKTIPIENFDYLDHSSGDIVLYFFGYPLFTSINSLDIYLLNPKYYDQKMQIINYDPGSTTWNNSNHQITYYTYWRQRIQDQYTQQNVSTNITFFNLDSDDPTDVTISISMEGENFGFKANLSYYDDLFQNLMYNLYISVIIVTQLLCGIATLKRIGESQVRLTKMSLLTLGYCSVEDFASAMSFLQFVISATAEQYFFIVPAALYLILFVLFDMKLMFLVWRNHHFQLLDNPELFRKKLTKFYIIFCTWLFLYLGLEFFFEHDEWFIIISHLLLVPQIVHNVKTGTKSSFEVPFIFGYVLTRVLILLYDRGCPENFFKKRQDLSIIVVVFTIYLFCILFLLMQYCFGSRFFFPKRFQPQVFTYRRRIKQNQQNKEDQCSICLQNIFAKSHQGQIQEKLLPETAIMVTPCNHQFHPQCLLEWMEVKMECPTCRGPLPQQ